MLRSNEIMLLTSDGELVRELLAGVPGGVKASMFHTRAVEFESIARFVISFASDVSVGVFSAWLYDRMKDRGSEKTSIEGREVPSDVQQITIVINNTLQQHQQQSQDSHGKDS
jgi:hypothetical protein